MIRELIFVEIGWNVFKYLWKYLNVHIGTDFSLGGRDWMNFHIKITMIGIYYCHQETAKFCMHDMQEANFFLNDPQFIQLTKTKQTNKIQQPPKTPFQKTTKPDREVWVSFSLKTLSHYQWDPTLLWSGSKVYHDGWSLFLYFLFWCNDCDFCLVSVRVFKARDPLYFGGTTKQSTQRLFVFVHGHSSMLLSI